jgi:predicted S18 family serine protease
MITYKLKKGGVIECSGFTSDFTLTQLHTQISNKENVIKELTGNADLKIAIIDNVLKNNSFIAKLTPEMIHACFMYHENMVEKVQYTDKIKMIKSSLKKDKDELKEILKQIPELTKKLDVK